MSLKHLTSKLLAGGLTAGIVLIWWPHHYPTDGLEWLVLRGIVATLGFELMLLAYTPLEDRISRRLGGRRTVGLLRARVDAVPPVARTGTSFLFAGAALALPVALLATTGATPAKPEAAEPAKTRVVREVVVKRRVIRDEVVVPSGATAPRATDDAPAATGAAPAAAKPRAEREADDADRPAERTASERDADRTAATVEEDAPAPPVTAPAPTATAPTAAAVDEDASTAAGETLEP